MQEGRHCFSAKTLTVGVAPSSQFLLVRNEDQQGSCMAVLWGLSQLEMFLLGVVLLQLM